MDTVRFTNAVQPPASGSTPVAARVPVADSSQSGKATNPSKESQPVQAQHTDATTRARQDPSRELNALLERVAEYIDPARQSLSIEIHEDEESGQTVISVYDARTEELVRQIPPKELLRIATVMRDLSEQRERHAAATGLLLDEQA